MTKQSDSAKLGADSGATPLIAWLDALGRDDLAIAGGKGASLGELIRAGVPVPPGFVVTTAAYDRFVGHGDLQETILQALRDTPDEGSAIREAFERSPSPPEVEQDVLAAYERLGMGPVAVRSSATAEDLPEAAFAGQQDTFLNVVGKEALMDAVRRCWASLWTDRAISYRERQGVDRRAVKLAVVVQRMVAAEVAGVMFTANPVTGARDEIVVDASPGLGESIVSGLVTPDHYVLRSGRLGWRVVERRPGRREVVIRPLPGGGTERVEGPVDGNDATLPASALRRLGRLGATIEGHFGRPQDVEWAWADGRPFIVQSRPITALPEPAPRPSKPVQMWTGILTEIMPDRPYPLEFTTWGPRLLVTGLLGRMFQVVGLEVRLDEAIVEEDGVVVQIIGRFPVRPTPAVLLAPIRLIRLARRFDPARWHGDPLLAEMHSRVRALEARDLASLSWTELLDTVHEALAVPYPVGELRVRYLPRPALAMGRLRLMLALMGAGNRFGTILFTGIESRTMEANRELEEMAARIRSNRDLADIFGSRKAGELWAALGEHQAGPAVMEDLRAFLGEYGHREGGGTLQLFPPTWREAPATVLGILKGLVAAPPPPGTRQPAWEAARDEVLAHPLMRIRPLRSAFLQTLSEARWFPRIREDTRFYATMILPVLRQALLELGRRLATVGVIASPEEVFHLRFEELESLRDAWPPPARRAGELHLLVERRKERRAELERTPLVDPRLLRPAASGGENAGALVTGTPGSPGVAEGPVCVIRGSSEFGKLRPGDVLVAPYTNPAWTPLFQRAAAVVVDTGGTGSHAAIVAREYGIPAVMATVDGTARLQDGQHVRVDGHRGLVLPAT